jgi:hypothetical protein
MKEVVYYELLKQGETITGEVYRQQLMGLKQALAAKRPEWDNRHDKIILQHDNARPHVAIPVKNYMDRQNWEILPHPLYSPDMAPSDYHFSCRCTQRWHSSTSLHMKTSKNRSMTGSPQNNQNIECITIFSQ